MPGCTLTRPMSEDYGSWESLVSVSQDGLCALLGSPVLMSIPFGGFGGSAEGDECSELVLDAVVISSHSEPTSTPTTMEDLQ